ncbi:hypothetical protein DFJ74DRAFT_703582 [Hyaloraphidium curvatum]|nr:hypothetical protein DFJ74DRAFT_703582 [Hyaloraphidium curvatum]
MPGKPKKKGDGSATPTSPSSAGPPSPQSPGAQGDGPFSTPPMENGHASGSPADNAANGNGPASPVAPRDPAPTAGNGPASPAPPRDPAAIAEELKGRGNEAYKAGNYAEAVELYTESFEASGNPTVILNRAASYLMLRDYSSAMRDAQKVMETDRGNVKAIVRCSKALCGLGRVEDAETVLRDGKKVVDHHGLKEIEKELITTSRLSHHVASARQYLRTGNYTSALSSIESAMIALDSNLHRGTKDPGSHSYFTADSDLSAQPHEWILLRARILLVLSDLGAAQQAAHYGLTRFGHATSPSLLHLRALALYLSDTAASSVPGLLQRALSFDPDHKPSLLLLRLTKNVERIREEAKEAFGRSEWTKSIELYTDAISTLRTALSVTKLGWWEIDEDVEYGDDADSKTGDEKWAEKEAWRGGVVRVKCLSNIATAQSKLKAYEPSASAASRAISLLLVLSFPTAHASAHAEEMRKSLNESLFFKLHLRLADSNTKLYRHAEAFRAYSVAEGIKPNDPEVARAKRAAAKAEKAAARKDYYQILGLEKSCSEDEIRKAYRKLALQYHPDKQASLSDEEKAKAEEKFKDISEAYNCLIDPQKRRAHDVGADFDEDMGGMGGGMGGFPGGA